METLKVLDAMSCAGFVLDEAGCVLSGNERGRQFLGRELKTVHGRLVAADTRANRALQELIKSASGRHGRVTKTAATLPRPDGMPFVVRVLPIATPDDDPGPARVLVMVIDPDDCPEPTRNAFRELFGLTAAEIRVATALMCGCSTEEIARSSGTGIGTVRQQLKSIFAKTQTSRQSELVALLMRLSMAFAVEQAASLEPSPEDGAA
jgi:DNA-binding CsgD family transcriptional regulator